MSKANKIRVLEAFRFKEKAQGRKEELAFKVQLSKGEDPITMLYDQLKYTYPDALIDFYEAKAELFKFQDQGSDEQLPEEEHDLFDCDAYLVMNGSKILEHINSFTLSLKKFQEQKTKENDSGSERVWGKEIIRYHENFIQNPKSIIEQKNEIKYEPNKKGNKK